MRALRPEFESWRDCKDELSRPQRNLVTMLASMVDLKRQIIERTGGPRPLYVGMHDFLLAHGVWFEPTPWRFDFEKGADRMCFGNAICLSFVDGLRYVEGFVTTPLAPACEFHHAWCIEDGRLVDNTWLNTGDAYLGVEFSRQRADHATWFDDASILQNPANGCAIFTEPWKGEDFAREWEPSPGRVLMEQAKRAGRTMRRKPTGREQITRYEVAL